MTHHDELAPVRHLITTTLAHGFGSDEEHAAEEALVRDYFTALADQATGQIGVTQPVRLVSPGEAIAGMRVLRLLYGQRQFMAAIDAQQPERGIGESGLLDDMTAAIEALLTMLTAYVEAHGALPAAPAAEAGGPAPDPQLAALLRTMGGANHA